MVKLTNLAPLELKNIPALTQLELFNTLGSLEPVKPILSVKLGQTEMISSVTGIEHVKKVGEEWVPITHENHNDALVSFDNGRKVFLSEIKSIQLVDFDVVIVPVTNPDKPERFSFDESDKIEDVVSRLAEGNHEALFFLMDIVSVKLKAMPYRQGAPMTLDEQRAELYRLMTVIKERNLGGEQLVIARSLFAGTDEGRAGLFIASLIKDPDPLVRKINYIMAVNHQHRLLN